MIFGGIFGGCNDGDTTLFSDELLGPDPLFRRILLCGIERLERISQILICCIWVKILHFVFDFLSRGAGKLFGRLHEPGGSLKSKILLFGRLSHPCRRLGNTASLRFNSSFHFEWGHLGGFDNISTVESRFATVHPHFDDVFEALELVLADIVFVVRTIPIEELP